MLALLVLDQLLLALVGSDQ
jgi:hypothetical protein